MRPSLLLRAPVLTASGYGVHARQILWAILSSDAFDVWVESIRWGETSYVDDDTPVVRAASALAARFDAEGGSGRRYDISVQVTIPNEFRRIARLNVGVTAGIETDCVSPVWIDKANREVDVLVVPSHHSKRAFDGSSYRDSDGSTLAPNKPAVAVPEGVDTTVFNTAPVPPELSGLFDFPAPFNFVHVGLGLDKDMGEDRKNISSLVRWFLEQFRGNVDVGLVLKVGLVNNSLVDRRTTAGRISEIRGAVGCGEFPRIHLVHGRLSDPELAALYKHPNVRAFVSLTHGEGYGLPTLEAAACGLPVVATDWSGHLDFLHVDGRRLFVPVEHDLVQVPRSAVWEGVIEGHARWANPRETDAKMKMAKVVMSYATPKSWADELAVHVAGNYSLERVGYRFVRLLSDAWNATVVSAPTGVDDLVPIRERVVAECAGRRSLLYTMPMSAGDVFMSTGVVTALRRRYPGHVVYFATDRRYASILDGNADVDFVIPWQEWMSRVDMCERVFDEVYTPNMAVQTVHSNWVHGGKGRLLLDEVANACGVEPDEPRIVPERPSCGVPDGRYVVFHPGSGTGQWEARNYLHWQSVVSNLRRCRPDVPVVQVGTSDEPAYDGVVDLRGKTADYRQLAWVVSHAALVVGIDSVTTHMAAAAHVPHVALFGSSYPTSTGPRNFGGWDLDGGRRLSVLLETPDRYACDRACYKYQCSVDREHPCINEIRPETVFTECMVLLPDGPSEFGFVEHRPTISGYTYTLDAVDAGIPFEECVRSMLGFCDEVVVVEGGSTDGTRERLEAIDDPRVRVVDRRFDWEEPGMDGMQKAFGRAMCSGDFLWQMDADEVVHEDDYGRIRRAVMRFPRDVDILHLPIVEMWGNPGKVRTDRHSWKWRLSRNNFRITHGIRRSARVLDEATGKTHGVKGRTDGAEYIDVMTGEDLPHRGYYTDELERVRVADPAEYGRIHNARIFNELPCVFHYSWCDLPRKIRNFRDHWDRCWNLLYRGDRPEQRFFAGRDPTTVTDEEIREEARRMYRQGGEHGPGILFDLGRTQPALMAGWISRMERID